MHGVLEFKTADDEGCFRLYNRSSKRTKSGCLSCRTRHTKCDEQKPICGGCVRNHLLCSWPGTARTIGCISSGSAGADHANCARRVTPSCQLLFSSPDYAPSHWPRLQGRPKEQRLLHHYIERSVKRLVVRNGTRNPFVAYLLPLAQQHDGFLHAALAISASHLSYDDPKSHTTALSHYGIALRAVKYMITEFGNGLRRDPLEIVILLLVLCNYEVYFEPFSIHHWFVSLTSG